MVKSEYFGHTREELDKVCKCGHKREYHAVGFTIRGRYCFAPINNKSFCNCKDFEELKKKR